MKFTSMSAVFVALLLAVGSPLVAVGALLPQYDDERAALADEYPPAEMLPTTAFCPLQVGVEDPVYTALCATLGSAHALLQILGNGSVEIVTYDHDDDVNTTQVPVDADGDGRADLALLRTNLRFDYQVPAMDPAEPTGCDIEPAAPEVTTDECVDPDGRAPLVDLYVQLDYFYTDNDDDSPDEWYAYELGHGFDVAIDGMLYSPTTGARTSVPGLSGGMLRVTNDFRDEDAIPDLSPSSMWDYAIYYTGADSDALGAPGGQALPGGRCILCIDIDANRILFDEDPSEFQADPSQYPYAGGLLDLDILLPGDDDGHIEDSIGEGIDHDGDGASDATPTALLIHRGNAAAGPVESVRAATTAAWSDRAGMDLNTVHIKWPQDPGQAAPDFARYTAYSNIDDDDDVDAVEARCTGNPSNPTNPLSDCADIDADGLPNGADPAPLNPVILDILAPSGPAPHDAIIQYNCPTDADYQLNLGDVLDNERAVTLRTDRSGDLRLVCGAGLQSVSLAAAAGGAYLNLNTSAARVVPVSMHAVGASGNAVTGTVTVDASQIPYATLSVSGDETSPPVQPVITYTCGVPAPAMPADATLTIERPSPADPGDVIIDADCDGAPHDIDSIVFNHLGSVASENRLVSVMLEVHTDQHPDIEVVAHDTVIVGSYTPPTLTITANRTVTGEAPLSTPDITLTLTCSVPPGDSFVSGSVAFGFGTPRDVLASECDGQPFTVDVPDTGILNNKRTDKPVFATLAVTTALAGGPYKESTQIALVLGNDAEPGALVARCMTVASCPDGAIPGADPNPSQSDSYQVQWAFVPADSLEGQTITGVQFQVLNALGKITSTVAGVEADGEWRAPATTRSPGTSIRIAVNVTDNGGYTGRVAQAVFATPAEIEANAVPVIGDVVIEEDLDNADGTAIAMKIDAMITDAGSFGRPAGTSENDVIDAVLEYWPVDDPLDVASVALEAAGPCDVTTVPTFIDDDIEVVGCESRDDGDTANGESFIASFTVASGVSYMYHVIATDDEGANATSPDELMPEAETQEAVLGGILQANDAIDAIVAEVQALIDSTIATVEETPTVVCGAGNESDPIACLAHNVNLICADDEAFDDPTKCQGDVIEGILNAVLDIVNPAACQYGGTLGDGCEEQLLQNVTRIVGEGFDGIVCTSLAGNFLAQCGGSPSDPIPMDPWQFIGNSECNVTDTPGTPSPECGETSVQNPLGDLDQTDVHDTDGDGNVDEANGQVDLIEQRYVVINPDEPGDDPDDKWDGQAGATIHVFDPSTLFQEPRLLLTLRVGDVAGTAITERVVVQQYSAGEPDGVDCIATATQPGGAAPAVFHYQGVAFRDGVTTCGSPQSSSNLRISQADILNDGYQGAMVWVDDNNDGQRSSTDANADAWQKSSDDIVGYRFALASDGAGVNLTVNVGNVLYAIAAGIGSDGDAYASATTVVYGDAAGTSDDEPSVVASDVSYGHYDADAPFSSNGTFAGRYASLNLNGTASQGITLHDDDGDGQIDRVNVNRTTPAGPGPAGDVLPAGVINEDIDLTAADLSPVNAQIAAVLASIAEGSPEAPSGFGPIDDNDDGAPEGAWVDGDGDGARAADGSEDTYFSDLDPEAVVGAVQTLVDQQLDDADQQIQGIMDTGFPPCGEETAGMPCQIDGQKGIREALGLPGNSIYIRLPVTGTMIWI